MVVMNAEYTEESTNGAVTSKSLAAGLPKEDSKETPAEGDKLTQDQYESPEMLTDLYDARVLLLQAMILMSYFGNRDLSGKITDKERARMRKLSAQIKPYLEETSLQWEFDDDAIMEGDQPTS